MAETDIVAPVAAIDPRLESFRLAARKFLEEEVPETGNVERYKFYFTLCVAACGDDIREGEYVWDSIARLVKERDTALKFADTKAAAYQVISKELYEMRENRARFPQPYRDNWTIERQDLP